MQFLRSNGMIAALAMIMASPGGMLHATDAASAASDINKLAERVLGRYQGPEYIYATTTPMTAGTAAVIRPPNPIPISRAIESLHLVWRGRIVIGTADYTAGVPEAPQTLIERIVVRGNHSQWGSQIPIDLTGATAFSALRCFQTRGNVALNGTAILADGSQASPSTGINAGTQGTYDLEVHYMIPMAPWGVRTARQGAPYWWREENWGQSLQIEVTVGDKTSLGTPAGGTTVTFTAFGSGAGQPSVEIYANYSMLGPLQGIGNTGLVIRSEQIVAPALTGVTSGVQLGQFLRKNVTTNVLVKSGIMLTGQTAGLNPFASLSDVQLDRTRVMAAQKPIKDLRHNYATKAYYQRMFNTTAPQGYLPLSWIEGGSVFAALRADQMPDGAPFTIETDVLTANANNQQRIVQEQIYGGPFAG